MGVTIESKHHSIDMGGYGFYRLRLKVAELTNPEIYDHYNNLLGYNSLEIDSYNQKIEKLSKKYNGKFDNILDFLYTSDCDGEMDVKHCKSIWEIIKDCNENILFGYSGRYIQSGFLDFKEIVRDCIDSETSMIWF